MPILDQGYQHWNGSLQGHAWRWLAVTRQGLRAQAKNRWVWLLIAIACIPSLVLSAFLIIWGLFEQKSSLLTPLLIFFQNSVPEEIKAGPRGFRTTLWTLAFNQFLTIQVSIAMLLVLLVGPDLISQDLRFNAMPLYFARPVRRFDYFIGKLGVIAAYLSAVMIFPILLAAGLGVAFSLDPTILRDTWRVIGGSLAFGVVVVLSAGTLMLAISSLSKNSRYVGAAWIAIFLVSNVVAGVLTQTVRQPWCPLVSYNENLTRVRDSLLDTDAAWAKISKVTQAGRERIPRPFGVSVKPPPPPMPPDYDSAALNRNGSSGSDEAYTWRASAVILAGIGLLSAWILGTRVRSLDRLR